MGKKTKMKRIAADVLVFILLAVVLVGGSTVYVCAKEQTASNGVSGDFDLSVSQKAKQPGESLESKTSVGEKFGSFQENGNTLNGTIVGGAKDSGNSTGNTQPAGNTSPKSYKITPLTDRATGMTVARCYAPSDYTADCDVSWCGLTQSPSYPAQVYAYAVSPDQNTAMGYFSPVGYYQLLDYSMDGIQVRTHQDGVFDVDCMLPMLSFRTAESYCDMIAERLMQGQSLQVVSQKEITQEQQQMMNAAAAALEQAYLQSGATQAGFSLDGSYYGEAMRTYSLEISGIPYLLTVSAATQGLQMSSSVDATYFMGNFHSSYIIWDALYSFFLLTPESYYEEDYVDFEQFALNTTISDEMIAAMQKLSQQIVQAMTQRSSESMAAVSDYCQSSISSYVGNEASYSEEAFSDYILDQNDYTLPDGDHVKVSTSFDYVYSDDYGNIYVSNSTQEPAGTTRLYPN